MLPARPGWCGHVGEAGERLGVGKYVFNNSFFVYEGSIGTDGRKNGACCTEN
jgi:hypothetical protein